MSNDAIQKIVTDNLNDALENDYTEILSWPVDDIVADLIAFADDCADLEEEIIKPHVERWLKNRKLQ